MTLPSDAWVQPGIEHAASSEAWLRHTLEEILSQIRVLLDIDGCAFQTVDLERSHIFLAASWFETPELRATMQPILERTYDPERGGVTEAAVERDEPILIRDVETWRGAGALRARLRNQLDPESAETAWEWYRTSTFISCPVRTAGGRTLGVLALSASPPRPPLSDEHLRVTEVFASLAALALERSELLEREANRARTEELLHSAAQKMTASLDLDTVYRAIAEQAALVSRRAARDAAAPGQRDGHAASGRSDRRGGQPAQAPPVDRRGHARPGRAHRRGVRQPARGPRALSAVDRRRGHRVVRPRPARARPAALRRAVGRPSAIPTRSASAS